MSSLGDLKVRLDSRKKVSPAVFSENMKLREETHHLGTTASTRTGGFRGSGTAGLAIRRRVSNCCCQTQHVSSVVHVSAANYVPRGSADDLFPGTWYLTRVDDKFRREYARRPLGLPSDPECVHGSGAAEVWDARWYVQM